MYLSWLIMLIIYHAYEHDFTFMSMSIFRSMIWSYLYDDISYKIESLRCELSTVQEYKLNKTCEDLDSRIYWCEFVFLHRESLNSRRWIVERDVLHVELKSEWVLPGNATITHCKPTHGIASKRNTKHWQPRYSKQTISIKQPALSSSARWL